MFDFFRFKKPPVIEDVVPKEPTQPPVAAAAAVSESPNASPETPQEPETPVSGESAVVSSSEPAAAAPRQMDDATVATAEDVIAAYKIFLGRLPESMEVVTPRVGVQPVALLVDFLKSREFLDQTPKAQLVLALAKIILEERKAAAPVTAEGADKPTKEAAPPEA